MNPTRGNNSPRCHSTFAVTQRCRSHAAAWYMNSWYRTMGARGGRPTGLVMRCSTLRFKISLEVAEDIPVTKAGHNGVEDGIPVLGAMHIALAEQAALEVAKIVEAEEGMVAGASERKGNLSQTGQDA